MLTTLHIENYALIRETDVSFGPGFVAITGETGAGKSIMLGAMGLLLGQRADTAVLADKKRKCVVEARFDISGLGLRPLFEEVDVDYDDLLILRREILPAGKSRAFANDTPVQLPFLKALAPRIIDIHSQHQTLTLADSHFRLSLLDTLNTKHSNLHTYQDAYQEYSALKHELEELTSTEAQNRREADYLQSRYALEYLRHKLTARSRLQLSERLALTLNYRFQDRTGTYTDTQGEVQAYHPYSLVDGRIDWRLHPCTFYVEVNNLLNHRYVDYGNVPQPGRWLMFGCTVKAF